jgi:hypothetical protein
MLSKCATADAQCTTLAVTVVDRLIRLWLVDEAACMPINLHCTQHDALLSVGFTTIC